MTFISNWHNENTELLNLILACDTVAMVSCYISDDISYDWAFVSNYYFDGIIDPSKLNNFKTVVGYLKLLLFGILARVDQ